MEEYSLAKVDKGIEMEYNAIREEIVNLTNSKDQFIIMMYSLCISIIGLTTFFKVEEIIGLIYIVLIPFQALINTKLFQIARCGAYINVFIEPNAQGLKWEKIIHIADKKFNQQYRFNLGNIQLTRNLAKYGSSIFSVLVVIMYFRNKIIINEVGISINRNNFWLMLLYIAACLFVFYLNRKGSNFEKIYDTYLAIFQNM